LLSTKFPESSQNFDYKQRQKLSSLIYKLKKEGLVQAGGRGWQITQLGLNKIKALKNKLSKRPVYQKEKDGLLKIISFDIPEKIRNHRLWLRVALKNLDFKMLQKSVWLGKAQLPQQFVKDLQKRGLVNHVKILGISQTGNLREYF